MQLHGFDMERFPFLRMNVKGGDGEVAGTRRNQGEGRRRIGGAVDGHDLGRRTHRLEAIDRWQRDVHARHKHPEDRGGVFLFNGAVLHREGDGDPVAGGGFRRIDLLAERGGGEAGRRGEGKKRCQP